MIYYPIPMHMSTAYSSDGIQTSLPVSEDLRNKVMSLPMHPYLKKEDPSEAMKKDLLTKKIFP